uniref:Uncharacterized protein n=1 Tax=Anguilla anguilla TaxID=7936 RepID=A0A0E9R7E2_ANGAN
MQKPPCYFYILILRVTYGFSVDMEEEEEEVQCVGESGTKTQLHALRETRLISFL